MNRPLKQTCRDPTFPGVVANIYRRFTPSLTLKFLQPLAAVEAPKARKMQFRSRVNCALSRLTTVGEVGSNEVEAVAVVPATTDGKREAVTVGLAIL